MGASGIHDEEDFVVYNGFKVKFLYDGNDNFIYLRSFARIRRQFKFTFIVLYYYSAPYGRFIHKKFLY
jgi:hypothetical protein